MLKEMRNKLAIERDKWFESAEGKKCLDAKTLGSEVSAEYLKNRLEFAFLAGAAANAIPNQEPANNRYCGHESLADMISTHTHVWRDLLEAEAARNNRERPYLDHELNALSDIEGAIKFELDNPFRSQPAKAAAITDDKAVSTFLSLAEDLIKSHPFLYVEIARTRTTDWMAMLRERPHGNFIAQGQGLTAVDACTMALSASPKPERKFVDLRQIVSDGSES